MAIWDFSCPDQTETCMYRSIYNMKHMGDSNASGLILHLPLHAQQDHMKMAYD
jgi:hypothetical protein